jgi:hypothetical protein
LIIVLALGFLTQACAAGWVQDKHDQQCNFCEHWRYQAMARLTALNSGGSGAHGNVSR